MNRFQYRPLAIAFLAPLLICSRASDRIEACIPRMLSLAHQDPTIDTINAIRSICEQISLADTREQLEQATAGIYAGQLGQNTVMLWLVVSLTVGGVLLSALQLLGSYKLARLGHQNAASEESEVTLERGRLVVRSSVVGIIILALSFAFFLVYVLYVYRINPSDDAPASHEPPANAVEVSR